MPGTKLYKQVNSVLKTTYMTKEAPQPEGQEQNQEKPVWRQLFEQMKRGDLHPGEYLDKLKQVDPSPFGRTSTDQPSTNEQKQT